MQLKLIYFLLVLLSAKCYSEERSKRLVDFKDLWDKVKHPSRTIKSLFQNNQSSQSAEAEHGRWHYFGRDLIAEGYKRILPQDHTVGLDTKQSTVGGVERFKNQLQVIVPGTKWCGDGDTADNHDDLGQFSGTDKCCREHDECPLAIPAGQTKFRLINNGLFTRSHCDCDAKFYNCLHGVDSFVAKKVGFTYFTVLGPQCFTENRKDSIDRSGKSVQRPYKWQNNPNF